MDRLDAMMLFASAVDGGSLAAAARRHARSPAAVTRAVALLEREVGARLLRRSTRKLNVTPLGERHLAVWRNVLAMLDEIAPVDEDAPLRGSLRLTAPELFGRLHVLPLVERFLQAHQHVSARILLRNRLDDLVGEGIDLAVRLAPLPDSSMSAIRLGAVRTLVCAAPSYVERAGSPTSPADLERHACIALDAVSDAERWTFADAGGRKRSIRISSRLQVDHAAAGIDAAVRGYGIVRVRSYQVSDLLAEGRLMRLLPAWEPPVVPASLLFLPERSARSVLRRLIDELVPGLRERLSGVEASIADVVTG